MNLVDYYAASFIVFTFAFFEITGIFWVYGLENILDDIEFMIKKRPSIYWRLCWGVITPVLLALIFVYSLIDRKPLEYGHILYPDSAYGINTFFNIFIIIFFDNLIY